MLNKKHQGFSSSHFRTAALLAGIALSVPLAANSFAADKAASKGGHDSHSSAAKSESDSMHSMEMHKMMKKGMQDMESMPMSGDTDHDFAMMMRKHHEHGVEMAKMEAQHGKDAKMRAMAKKIMASQQKEIKEFDQWLSKHKASGGKAAGKH